MRYDEFSMMTVMQSFHELKFFNKFLMFAKHLTLIIPNRTPFYPHVLCVDISFRISKNSNFEVVAIKMKTLSILIFILSYSSVIGGSEWLNRLPSLKVKVGTDGILVSTGPSREEIYWLIGYAVIGSIVFILISVALGMCVYKFCCSHQPRSLPHPVFGDRSHNGLLDPEAQCIIQLQNRQRMLMPLTPTPDPFNSKLTVLQEKSRGRIFNEHEFPYRSTN